MYLSNVHIFHTFYYCSPYQYLVDSSLHYRNDNFLVTVVLLISVTQAWPTSNVNGVNLPTKAKIAGLSQQCGWNSMEASNCKVAPGVNISSHMKRHNQPKADWKIFLLI